MTTAAVALRKTESISFQLLLFMEKRGSRSPSDSLELILSGRDANENCLHCHIK